MPSASTRNIREDGVHSVWWPSSLVPQEDVCIMREREKKRVRKKERERPRRERDIDRYTMYTYKGKDPDNYNGLMNILYPKKNI